MQRDNDQNISLPLKPIIVWLVVAIGGSMTGATFAPDPIDVFDRREWIQTEESIKRIEAETKKIRSLESRLAQLRTVCTKK